MDVAFANLCVKGRVIADLEPTPSVYLTAGGVPMFVNDHDRNLRFLTTAAAQT